MWTASMTRVRWQKKVNKTKTKQGAEVGEAETGEAKAGKETRREKRTSTQKADGGKTDNAARRPMLGLRQGVQGRDHGQCAHAPKPST